MDFMNAPIYNNYGVPMTPGVMAPNFAPQQQKQQQVQQQVPINPAIYNTPKIVSNGPSIFRAKDDNEKGAVVPTSISPIVELPEEKKKRSYKKKTETGNSKEIIRAEDTIVTEELPTAYSYMETNSMLHETLAQIDLLNSQLVQEFETIKNNRTMKNKYNALAGLTENIGSLINSRVQVIKEINSTISKANDMDYKKEKDRKSAMAVQDDDKYIADLYKSFIQNPINVAPAPQMPQVDPAIFGSGVIRADLKSGNYNSNEPVDASYLNYMSNLTPEQNLMRYENNPNVKQVVVFDAVSGNKFFQVMDLSTGQVIPNVPVYDQMFMEDTVLDMNTKIAKNINLNETYPIVVINEGVTKQY